MSRKSNSKTRSGLIIKEPKTRQFGENWRNFMKAVFAPVIKEAIDPQKDRAALTEGLLDRFAAKVSRFPRETRHFVAVAVLEKVS